MVDLHCHILPGIDDGAESMEVSVAMAQDAIADGITHVVATPHSSSEFVFDFAKVRKLRDQLQAAVGDRVNIATGCDFHLNRENLDALREDAPRFCINQQDYLLVEFNDYSIPPAMDQVLHTIHLARLRPIVTHPERNGILRARPDRLKRWVEQGTYVQVTAGALTGGFGTGSQNDALRWIGQGLVHFVASDAHNTRGRVLRLQPGYDVVKTQFGEEKARALFVENPLAAFEGRDLPHVPQIESELPEPRRKRFFFF